MRSTAPIVDGQPHLVDGQPVAGLGRLGCVPGRGRRPTFPETDVVEVPSFAVHAARGRPGRQFLERPLRGLPPLVARRVRARSSRAAPVSRRGFGRRNGAPYRLPCVERRPGYGVAPARAVLEVQRHPAARGPCGVLHPMFWILGLTGNGVDRTRLRVSVTGVSAPLCRSSGGLVRVRPRRPTPDADRRFAGAASALPDRILPSPRCRGRGPWVRSSRSVSRRIGALRRLPRRCSPTARWADRHPCPCVSGTPSGRRAATQRRPTTLNPTP